MGTAAALAAVLTYRLVSFWLILIGGWTTMIFLTRANPRRLDPCRHESRYSS